MSAGDRDTLAAVLLKHQPFMIPVDPTSDCARCVDYPWESDEDDAAHVADVLLASDWLREQRAEAWDDAKDKTAQAYQHGGRYGAPRNPHRPYRTTEDTE